MNLSGFKIIVPNSIRIILGLFFIASGLLKLYPIEPFEILFVDIGISNWTLAPYLTRLLIVTELILGLFLLIGTFLRFTIYASYTLLTGFTLYLIYSGFILKSTEDCGCFGEFIKLNPIQSIVKNMVLLGGFYYLQYNFLNLKTLRFKKWLLIFIMIIALATPFILNPVDSVKTQNILDDKIGKTIDVELFDDTVFSEKNVDLLKGNKVICFFSLTCPVCKFSAQKLAVLEKKNNNQLPIYFVFWGTKGSSDELLNKFIHETKSQNISHKYLPTEKFFQLAGNSLPAIYYLENGIIIKKNSYRELLPDEMESFLKQQ